MNIHGPNGEVVQVTQDNRLKGLTVAESVMCGMAKVEGGWTLPFTQTGAANTTDNVVFHFENTSDKAFDFHFITVASAEAGLWTLESGRARSSGGTTMALAPLNVLSGKTQDMTAFFGTAIVVAGTAIDISYTRVAADTPIDILDNSKALIIPASGTLAIKFKADAGNNVMAVTSRIHGKPPWENGEL